MFKKTYILVLFLFLSSCGYEAINSKKNSINYNFSINKLTFIGERNVNLKIKEKLNNYTLYKKDKNFVLKISSRAEKVVLAKNLAGDPTSFKSTIIVNAEALIENTSKNNFQFIENFNYNNLDNKFDLKRYEREIKNNLAETVAEKLIFRLSNIK